MPFVKFDALDELGDDSDLGEAPSGAFEYESAEAKFNFAKLGPIPRIVFEALRAAGATAFRVRYDGGYDEGFSHPDAIFFGDEDQSPRDVMAKLCTPEFVAMLRGSAASDSIWGNAKELYANGSAADVGCYALDELAEAFSSRLLGDGFGNRRISGFMGAFTADLTTGEIVDHEGVERPLDME